MEPIIDLRSDTVTRPTPEMREAMARAVVGDDVAGDDPTVHELEARVAMLFGKQAGLFTPSGTMANLLAVLSQTQPGDEILTHHESHIYYYEGGGYASVAGCSIRFIDDSDAPIPGTMTPEAFERALRGSDIHFPCSRLVTIENTHNRGGGVVWPDLLRKQFCDVAADRGLKVHTDGARIWNASIASGIPLHELAEGSDTLSACLSKGLGCPVGSVLVGDQKTIDIARHKRKMLGGGMRQAGVIAAAGLHALDHHHLDRLAEDHRRASELASALSQLPIFDIDSSRVATNLVYAKLQAHALDAHGDVFSWQNLLESVGVRCYAESRDTLRFVTHLDINDELLELVPSRVLQLTK